MRSIYVYLYDADIQEMRSWIVPLSRPAWGEDRWSYPGHAEDPALLVEIFYQDDCWSCDYTRLIEEMGMTPALMVEADISGRMDGTPEVMEFVIAILERFSGVAQDDYSYHFWTLDELRAGAKVNDLAFFDYAGYWDREGHKMFAGIRISLPPPSSPANGSVAHKNGYNGEEPPAS